MNYLAETMELTKLDKDQLIQLCEALWALLQKPQAAPVLNFVPQPYLQNLPYVPLNVPTNAPTWPGGTTVCNNESTQLERFGVRS